MRLYELFYSCLGFNTIVLVSHNLNNSYSLTAYLNSLVLLRHVNLCLSLDCNVFKSFALLSNHKTNILICDLYPPVGSLSKGIVLTDEYLRIVCSPLLLNDNCDLLLCYEILLVRTLHEDISHI